ncbi:MAG TPA: dihydropteroate synthase, partial [Flavobacterium sp.]|nr:dihydropteroate synthase [Flavobacterium sp.]
MDLLEPKVMGIINLTPDSFYRASRTPVSLVVDKAGDMLLQGAAFLDLGGYSSRPGATDISIQEETDRVVPAIEAVVNAFPDAIISVDTFRAAVAEASIVAGASIVNDISAGDLDNEMLKMVARHQAPYIMMHMRGTPQNMQQFTQYDHLELEVLEYFSQRIAVARAAGINDIILDPGFGFSKTVEQNFELLRNLKGLSITGLPLLV